MRLPVSGVTVRVIVYGKEEAAVKGKEFAAALVRAAEVPAIGFDVVEEEWQTGSASGRVLNRRPVLRPMTELSGL